MSPLAIAVAQTVPVRGDVGANVAQHLRLAEAAARDGVGLLLFPELSLTGYEIELGRSLAFTLDDARLAPLAEAAAATGTTLVAGAPLLLDGRLHIGAIVLAPDGSRDAYTKQHLGAFPESARCDGTVPPAESTAFEPGARDPLLVIGGRAAAVAICADANRASHPEAAAARGATIYLASMFVIPSELARDEARLASCAVRHCMTVAFSNHGGPSGGLAAGGGSAIWSDRGELLARLGTAGAGLVVAIEGGDGWSARALPLEGAPTTMGPRSGTAP